jgi:putative hemolysin
MEEVYKVIDVEKAIRSSKSGFIKSLPGFIVRIIRRIVREDEMNATIFRNRLKTGVPFVNDVLNDWNVKTEIKGSQNIPDSGRFIFVANHPVGAIDALSFLSLIHSFFPEVVSPSNELLTYIPQLKPLMVGINVFGKNTKETVDKLNKLFESDVQIMIFPSGEVSRRKNGIISDSLWQKSFITKAIQFKRDIIPVHISGRNSNLFYYVATLRKFLGIKMYIETIFLPDEMLKQRSSTVTMSIGKVIPWQTFTNESSHMEWAQKVRGIVYSITDSHYKKLK